ncbi:MAG: type II toxin-antitoxin system HicA family toxin [Methanosarcina sp.]|uniref:type II toxin-antitoxin system HicA family toxin n=1 Tax=Methanosarcina sp. TaxID=2213 RepID=UPI002605645A|nr:type II toxin-antitoxin system HicA family toxin [Methanosarcina sp.]MDD3248187.1 type II toxin-antitoxin system HicA family toxin [Methanosarcina sp.]MDD3248431.1 type II toxin-antitoxin system HicA family toxin [Methanosarcina sp.]MDD4248983.1 type II toxin-antitoxin system HicA family toxin [Methanosarcina sp.]
MWLLKSELPVISGMQAIKAFSKAACLPHRQVGSHVVLRKEGSKVTLTVPKHKGLKPGLLRNLIKASGLTVEEFEALLK